jgi:hypothetical protein
MNSYQPVTRCTPASSPSNYLAMLDAARQVGAYPIR